MPIHYKAVVALTIVLAVNFDIGPQQDLGASNIMAMFDAFEKQHRTKMDLAVISGPTPTF